MMMMSNIQKVMRGIICAFQIQSVSQTLLTLKGVVFVFVMLFRCSLSPLQKMSAYVYLSANVIHLIIDAQICQVCDISKVFYDGVR